MQPSTRRLLRWVLIVVAAALAIAVVGFVWWGSTPLGPTDSAIAALQSDATVTVAQTDAGWTFAPVAGTAASGEPTAGYVFYPGGHVDARSYAPYARDIAAQGYLAVVPVMPLSLAVLSPNAASKAIDAYPGVKRWVVGGHSLGGVMAARYADQRPANAEGLVLLASYPSGTTDLSDDDIDVASLVGSQDTVVNMPVWENARDQLPAQSRIEVLRGGNHAQFGDYGLQPGDTPDPEMSAEAQRAAAVEATVRILRGE